MERIATTVENLAAELIDRLYRETRDFRLLLGIVGYPGAGKSTLAEALVRQVNLRSTRESAVVVPMDGYHYSNEKLTDMGLLPLKGIPSTFDAASFVALLKEIRANRSSVFAPRFDRSIEASIENAIEVKPEDRLIVVEGNYLLLNEEPWLRIREILDEVWFIDTTFDVINPRLIARHRDGGKDLDAARKKVDSTDMPNARIIENTKKFADRLVSFEFS